MHTFGNPIYNFQLLFHHGNAHEVMNIQVCTSYQRTTWSCSSLGSSVNWGLSSSMAFLRRFFGFSFICTYGGYNGNTILNNLGLSWMVIKLPWPIFILYCITGFMSSWIVHNNSVIKAISHIYTNEVVLASLLSLLAQLHAALESILSHEVIGAQHQTPCEDP